MPTHQQLDLFKNQQLPVYQERSAYTIFAMWYDDIMQGIHYLEWENYLYDLIKYHCSPRKSLDQVLDLGCGTGSMTILLKQNGLPVQGLDSSKEMLSIASKKFSQLGLHIPLHLKSMFDLSFNESFDLIFSFNNCFNYILDINDLSLIFSKIYAGLQPGGVFIFDLASEIHVLKNFHQKKSYYQNDHYACIWSNFYNKKKRILESTLDFLLPENEEVYRERHIQKLYSYQELENLLQSFFSHVFVYHSFTLNRPQKKSLSYHFVCQKEGSSI